MRLAWFTPLPPMASGIADYSSEIVPHVAALADVDVVCPPRRRWRRLTPPAGSRLVDPDEYFENRSAYDACFYHLGNNPYHEFVYLAARRHPEIAVFHDAVLHHLIAHITIEAGRSPGRYEGILHGEYGDLGSRLARLRRSGVATDFEKFLFPVTSHVAVRAKGLVVHSRDAAIRMRETAPEVPLVVIPHHAGEPPPQVAGVDRAEARRRLRLPPDAFLVGHFGFITKPKQPAAVVGGFARLRQVHPNSLLLMVGDDRTGGALMRLSNRLGISDAVRPVGYVDLERFYLYLRAVDVAINLRYPTAGETSGTMARSLAEGRVVVVNNYASWAEIPGDVALKVEIDGPQADQVGEHLIRLAGDPALREAMESRARRYAAAHLDPVKCAKQYVDFARRVEEAGSAPARLGRSAAPSPSATRTRHEQLRDGIDLLASETLPETGNAAYVDELYRTLLRRPAEDSALRTAGTALTEGGTTRAQLAERMVRSREFGEVRLIEELLRDLEMAPREFTLREGDPPLGPDTTERVVEVPWVLSRYRGEPRALDVGYAFASGVYLSALLRLGVPSLHGMDWTTARVPSLKRARADLRALPYRDESFGVIFCISTLEHVGRDNSGYGLPYDPFDASGDARTLAELARVLETGGRLLVTVPFGRREDHGWFVQYDRSSWSDLVGASPFEIDEQQAFRLDPDGWTRVSDLRGSALLAYGDGVPGARGVVCATLVKPA